MVDEPSKHGNQGQHEGALFKPAMPRTLGKSRHADEEEDKADHAELGEKL